jgi:hypothetical protein
MVLLYLAPRYWGYLRFFVRCLRRWFAAHAALKPARAFLLSTPQTEQAAGDCWPVAFEPLSKAPGAANLRAAPGLQAITMRLPLAGTSALRKEPRLFAYSRIVKRDCTAMSRILLFLTTPSG